MFLWGGSHFQLCFQLNIFPFCDTALRSGTNAHDLALLTLCSPVRWGPQVQPVCLPRPGDIRHHQGETALVTGWGTTTSGQVKREITKINILYLGGRQPNSLRVANVTIIPHADCEKVRS